MIQFVLEMRGELGNIILDWRHSHQTHSPKWLAFTLFILISLVLVVSNWTAINTVNFELSDCFPDDRAKHLTLWLPEAKSVTSKHKNDDERCDEC